MEHTHPKAENMPEKVGALARSVFKIMGILIIIGIFYRNGTIASYWYKLGQFFDFRVYTFE